MSAYTLRWGILATGGIATTFARDLGVKPCSRDVKDVVHVISAVASSRSSACARDFLVEVKAPPEAKAYGSYHELVEDQDCDIIYIATPHSHHFQHAMLCLQAGKHVLCEKPLTVNAKQAKLLIEVARQKNVFFMEAMWTRYLPLTIEVSRLIREGKVGKIYRVIADVSFGDDVEVQWGMESRMVNMNLAGGALLDLGIYSFSWVFQILYNLQENPREKPDVISFMTKYSLTGVDETTSVLFNFPGTSAQGIATTSIRVSTDPGEQGCSGPAVRIQGSKGEVQISHPAFRPEHFRVILNNGSKEDVYMPVKDGRGMFWEADEAARCIRDGLKESQSMSWHDSILIMENLDEVRRQGQLQYPDSIESVDY